jgi:simple sugar transport system permease protein
MTAAGRRLLVPAAWVLAVAGGLVFVLPGLGVSVQDTLIRATPLVNLGGEGQFTMGTVFTTAAVLALGGQLPAAVLLPILAVAGMLGGLVWAGICAGLRVGVNLNEALSTLLLNFVAPLILAYLVFGQWKDPESFNLPLSKQYPDDARLPVYGLTRMHAGILLTVVVAVAVWVILDFTRWGFRARVVGGNPEAARRGGLPVGRMMFIALASGGALAGLGGMVEATGIEGVLRPGIGVGFGYIGFLASWLVGHRPLAILGSALLLAAISVGGDSLQIDHGLPSTSVYVVMALVLLVALAVRGGARERER